MPYVLVIDLQPAYTTVAVQWDGRPPTLLAIEGNNATVASMIGVAASDEVLVGTRAETLRAVDPSRVCDNVVQRIGDPRPIEVAGRPYAVSDIVGLFLGAVYSSATKVLRGPPSRIAICHPAFLDNYRRQLLLTAAADAGLPPVELIVDYTAVAAYTTQHGPTEASAARAFGGLLLLQGQVPWLAPPPGTSTFAAPAPFISGPSAPGPLSRSARPSSKRSPLVIAVAAMLLIAALVVVVVRSGDDDIAHIAAGTAAPRIPVSRPGTGGAPSTTGASPQTAPAGAAMTETIELDPRAVWQDGSPITTADFECTWRAFLNTGGSVNTAGYDSITAVTQGKDAHEVVISYSTPFAAYRTLFSALVQRSAVDHCDDVSNAFQTTLATSGREWKIQSWSATEEVLVPNSRFWGTHPSISRLVIKPLAGDLTDAVTSGDIDYAFQLFGDGIVFQPSGGNVQVDTGAGSQFEALYFNQKDGHPFADPAVRSAFYASIDLDALFAQIYAPIAPGGLLSRCGPVIAGPLCPTGLFGNRFDLAKAAATMTAAGYAKNADGLWSKDGTVLDIKWMVTTDNQRRASAQAFLIPLLATAGFQVTADNCDAACVFQDRLPSLDYDMTMYTNTTIPDPGYLVPQFTSDNIPIDVNSGVGLNDQAWVNTRATMALHDSDTQLDPDRRAADIRMAVTEMDKDSVLIPLYQFPTEAVYRVDRVGRVDGQIDNPSRAFGDVSSWKDIDGDGQVTIGVADWPTCLNPVTSDCAGPFSYQWTVSDLVLPGVFDPKSNGYAITDLVTAEPTIRLG